VHLGGFVTAPLGIAVAAVLADLVNRAIIELLGGL